MLSIDHLQVELDAETGIVRAIDGLALAIRRGETFALVGESGCGKSMTALALMRLLPDSGSITAGQIQLDDTDLLGLPESAMRGVRGGRIGMIFQEPGTSHKCFERRRGEIGAIFLIADCVRYALAQG